MNLPMYWVDPVRRIYCVGRNYASHVREMGHDPDRDLPFFFMKPAYAIVETDADTEFAQALELPDRPLVGVGEFGLMEWTFFGLVGAACIVLGRLEPSYEGLAWVASLTGAAMLFLWGIDIEVSQAVTVLFAIFGADLGTHQEVLLWRVALVLAAVFIGGSYWAMWRASMS